MFSPSIIPATTILNVDDYPISREAISLILKQEGFAPIEAKTGAEALRYVNQVQQLDLVLLDVKLPDISGYEVCRRLKQNAATAAIPVLMISGVWDTAEDKTRSLDSGADGYLIKPVENSELIATIKALLKLRRAEKEARAEASESINRASSSSLPAHIAVLDRNGVIIAVNDAWKRFNHQNTPAGVFDNNAMIGMNYLKVCESAARRQNETAREAFEGLRSVLRGERDGFTMEYPCHLPGPPPSHTSGHTSESAQWYLLSATPLPEEVGGAVVSHLNITARVLAEEERDRLLEREQEAAAQAEAVSQMRDEFLTTASHELRAPLHAILGWAKLLRGKTLSEKDRDYALETIERSALAQSHIISDILDMSQAITGKLRLDVRPFDPILIVEAAIDTAQPGAEAKRVSIESVFDPSIKEITGDPDRMQQIAWNLVSNAVKFTPPGGKVKVQLRRANPDRGLLETGPEAERGLEIIEIVVQDSGAGIKPEFLPYVFDPFRQEDGSKTRKYGGLGLGLAIVRRLAELHGGEAIAESHGENQGATFTVRLPVVSAPAWAESGLDTIATFNSRLLECERIPQLNGVRILIVDDEPDSASLTGQLLNLAGADVKTVISATEALAVFERHHNWRPDIFISVIQLPGIDGYALMRKVREMEWSQGRNIPAIAITDYARAEDRIRALDAGFHIQIAKPVESVELLAVVESLAAWGA
jgi:signal transduction histidine kinase/DNA-binding response OmpR family regulator